MAKSIQAVQVGSFALRDPVTHEFLPSVPLYIEKTERVAESEAVLIRDIAHIFAGKMGQYIEGGGLTEDKAAAGALRPEPVQAADGQTEPGKSCKAKRRSKKKG